MRRQQLPILAWLLQRARWVEAVCPTLIRLYAQSACSKQQFIKDACQALEVERTVCFPDSVWLNSVSAEERLVFSLESQQQRSIHALMHEHFVKKRRTVTDVALMLRISTLQIEWYALHMRLKWETARRSQLNALIPFDLPEPPSREEMAEYVARCGRGTEQTVRFLSSNNLRLLPGIATGFNLRDCVGLEHEDLVQEGYFGLPGAAHYFDPNKGAFSTVATQNIRWRVMRAITYWRRKSGGHKRSRMTLDDLELGGQFACEWDPFEVLGKPGDPEFDDTLTLALMVADEELDERERMVITCRFPLDGSDRKTFAAIGKILSITKERVRQIETEALQKIARRFATCGIMARHVFG